MFPSFCSSLHDQLYIKTGSPHGHKVAAKAAVVATSLPISGERERYGVEGWGEKRVHMCTLK